MFTSSADVFRTRQAIGDLRSLIRHTPEETRSRLIAGFPTSVEDGDRMIERIVADGVRFRHPDDFEVHTSVLLAAALPDEDFPTFIFATALALSDMLQADDPPDTLFWNWNAFQAQYVLADPPLRAALMNGFRVAELAGRVELDPALKHVDCLRVSRDAVLSVLDGSGERALMAAILSEVDAREAGRLWSAVDTVSGPAVTAFRYLCEREEGLAPPDATSAALIPWS
jgi:sugar/nucleoside kinase (ribokinase family)